MPKGKKPHKKVTQLQPINLLQSHTNSDKIFLKTWQVYAAQLGFVFLDKIPNAHNINFLVLKKHFENYKLSEECIEINKEIETIRHKTISNPEFETLFDNASALGEQDIHKMAIALELESKLVDLKRNNYSDQSSILQEIFVLMNAFLPYYSQDIRNSWNLTDLLKACEKMHGIYFHSLNQLLSINIDLPLFKQMQAIHLCAMMMWISNANSGLELEFKLIMLALSTLEKCQQVKQMLAVDYPLDSDYKSLILPNPLNIVDTVYIYYENLNKNHALLPILKNLKEKLLNLGDKQSLRLPLLEELIFFLDKILNFGLSTVASINQKVYLFDRYTSYQEIMEKMLLSYNLLMNKEHLVSIYMKKLFDPRIDKQKLQKITKERMFKKYNTKLNASENEELNTKLKRLIADLNEDNILVSIAEFTQLYLDKNIDEDIIEIFIDEQSTFLVWKKLQELNQKSKKLKNSIKEYKKNSAQFSKELIEEYNQESKKLKEALEAKLAAFQQRKDKRADQAFIEKQLNLTNEECELSKKQALRLAAQQPKSGLDKAQENISHLSEIKNSDEKERRTLEEIYKHLGCKNLGLESLQQTISKTLQFDDVHVILILLSNLFDNFTSQLQNNLRTYHENYSKAIANTTVKFGTSLFTRTDRDNNKLINDSLPEIITCISEMETYAENALMALQIIKNLRSKIQDNTHYHAWCKAETFRILEYKDIYNKVSFNFEQFKENRINKAKAFLAGGIPSCKKTNTLKPIKESEVSEKLTALKQSFGNLNEKIKECLLIIQPMHSQMHEILDLSHKFSSLTTSKNTEVKTKIFQFFKQEFNPKDTVERKQIVLTALNQLLDKKYDPLKEQILSQINNDQTIDRKKFTALFKTIKDTVEITPLMGRSLSF